MLDLLYKKIGSQTISNHFPHNFFRNTFTPASLLHFGITDKNLLTVTCDMSDMSWVAFWQNFQNYLPWELQYRQRVFLFFKLSKQCWDEGTFYISQKMKQPSYLCAWSIPDACSYFHEQEWNLNCLHIYKNMFSRYWLLSNSGLNFSLLKFSYNNFSEKCFISHIQRIIKVD